MHSKKTGHCAAQYTLAQTITLHTIVYVHASEHLLLLASFTHLCVQQQAVLPLGTQPLLVQAPALRLICLMRLKHCAERGRRLGVTVKDEAGVVIARMLRALERERHPLVPVAAG